MSEPTTSVETASRADSAEEEILRLRDLLIAKDAELGMARGKLAEYEASSLHSAAAMMTRLRRLSPIALLKAIAARGAKRG